MSWGDAGRMLIVASGDGSVALLRIEVSDDMGDVVTNAEVRVLTEATCRLRARGALVQPSLAQAFVHAMLCCLIIVFSLCCSVVLCSSQRERDLETLYGSGSVVSALSTAMSDPLAIPETPAQLAALEAEQAYYSPARPRPQQQQTSYMSSVANGASSHRNLQSSLNGAVSQQNGTSIAPTAAATSTQNGTSAAGAATVHAHAGEKRAAPVDYEPATRTADGRKRIRPMLLSNDNEDVLMIEAGTSGTSTGDAALTIANGSTGHLQNGGMPAASRPGTSTSTSTSTGHGALYSNGLAAACIPQVPHRDQCSCELDMLVRSR